MGLLPALSDNAASLLDRPAGHHYRYLEIQLYLKFVLQGNSSLRGAAKSLQILLGTFDGLVGAPTYNCGRTWLMRLGLYELQRPLPQADDWALIVDHTVQIGVQKCLVIAAVPLSELESEWFSPDFSQLSILAIYPVQQSNADVVEQQLTTAVDTRMGGASPRMIVSDGCRELKRGIAQFQENHPGAAAAYDIKHKTALILKKALESDDRWVEFNKAVTKTRKAVLPSRFAHLAPPPLKGKARYMNMEPVIQWSQQMAIYLSNPFPPGEGEACEAEAINTHFRWLCAYQEDIAEWSREIEMLETASDYCRRYGYQRNTATELEPTLNSLAKGERSQKVARDLLAFLEEQAALAKEGERLLATSEGIESLFGKGKHIEKQQASSGFTSLVLALAACVTQPSHGVIKEALDAVKTSDVIDWAKENIGMTTQAKRQNTLGKIRRGTKTAQQLALPES